MKNLMLLVLGFMVTQTGLFAQREINSVNNKERMEERRMEMKQERDSQLNLTEDQSSQMDEINEAYREKMVSQRNTEREDRKNAIHTLNDWRTEEIRKVLNEEQFATWQEMQVKRQERTQGAMEKKKGERVRQNKKDTGDRPTRQRGPRGN